MNTLTIKVPHTVDIDTKAMQDKIFAVIETSWKASRNLAQVIFATPTYSNRILRNKHLDDRLLRDNFLDSDVMRMRF